MRPALWDGSILHPRLFFGRLTLTGCYFRSFPLITGQFLPIDIPLIFSVLEITRRYLQGPRQWYSSMLTSGIYSRLGNNDKDIYVESQGPLRFFGLQLSFFALRVLGALVLCSLF